MNEIDNLEKTAGVAGIPLLVAATELVKALWPELPSRWWPLVAVCWGVAWNVLLALEAGTDVLQSALWGFACGLGAAGLYSAAKALGKANTPK